MNKQYCCRPDYAKTISGEGLPLVEDSERRGDLIIDFNIEFPAYLSAVSKNYVQKAFETQKNDSDDEGPMESGNRGHMHRGMFLDGKMYMRSDKLAQICRP